MLAIYSKWFYYHKAKNHIENPKRLKYIIKALKEENVRIERPYKLNKKIFRIIHLAHSWKYIRFIRRIFKEAYVRNKIIYIDPDTYISPYTWKASYKAALSVIKAVTLIVDNYDKVFVPVRPPGHHAGVNGIANTTTQGFCIFNNVAIGAMYARKKYGRIAILDIDLHHGNGTEEIVKGKKNVIYISLHAKYIYPGTGYESYDNIYNFPLEPGTDDKEYIKILENNVFPIIKEYDPDLVFVSLGFDAHRDDPLSPLNITFESYRKVFNFLKDYKTIYVLEGGYNYKVLYKGTKLLVKYH